jgi:hypothetical protein
VAHSQEEHIQAEQLPEQIAGADPESLAFEQVLKELVDAVTHHVEEEESSVLPGMRDRLNEDRLVELGEAVDRGDGPSNPIGLLVPSGVTTRGHRSLAVLAAPAYAAAIVVADAVRGRRARSFLPLRLPGSDSRSA